MQPESVRYLSVHSPAVSGYRRSDDADDGQQDLRGHDYGLRSLPPGNVAGLPVPHQVSAGVGDTVPSPPQATENTNHPSPKAVISRP